MIITQARAIDTDDTGDYGWVNLRRFLNVSFVEKEIIRLHGLEPRWHQDARKQATQLRYCLTQAREYSAAASAVTLATKPTLLYYSLMSLALAEILFKQTGLSSLDKARAEHRHHGLLFEHHPSSIVHGMPLIDAAAGVRAKPMIGSKGRTGTFNLWHNSCREMPVIGKRTSHLAAGINFGYQMLLGTSDDPLTPIPEEGLSLFDCLRALPGMVEHLSMQNIAPLILRGRVALDVYEQGNPKRYVTTVMLHPSPLVGEFLDNVMFSPDAINHVEHQELPNGGWLRITADSVQGGPKFLMPPGSAWTVDEVRLWPKTMPLNEFGYLYVALFIAGNYARYYPDRWLMDVETCSPLALAIEELIAVAEKTMSWLALSELSRIYFVRH